MRLLLLSRPECHLCERFAEELLSAFPALRGQVEEADVDSRDDWRRRWGPKIPVLLDPQGQLLCAGELDREAVTELLDPR